MQAFPRLTSNTVETECARNPEKIGQLLWLRKAYFVSSFLEMGFTL
jgi:hypothetical protein